MIIRKLEKKMNWSNPEWLDPEIAESCVPADAARCLRTTDNKLSVYSLDQSPEQMDRLIAALALTRNYLNPIDVAIIPIIVLSDCKIKSSKVNGNTPDSIVNEWHLDLVNLKFSTLLKFANAIKSCGERKRFQERHVKTAIINSLDCDYINIEKIDSKLKESLVSKGIL